MKVKKSEKKAPVAADGKKMNFALALANVLKKPDVTIAKKKQRRIIDKDAVAEPEPELAETAHHKASAHLTRARKEWSEREHVVPDHSTLDFERSLVRLATRGVVKLFNAVKEQKKELKGDAEPGVDSLTKSKFLALLKSGQAAPTSSVSKAPAPAAGPRWDVLKDEYLKGERHRFKDWDRDVADADADDEDGGDFSDDSDE